MDQYPEIVDNLGNLIWADLEFLKETYPVIKIQVIGCEDPTDTSYGEVLEEWVL